MQQIRKIIQSSPWFINTKWQIDLGFKRKNIEDEKLNELRKNKEILDFRKND